MYTDLISLSQEIDDGTYDWDAAWHEFHSQLQSYSLTDNFDIARETVRVMFGLKMSEDSETLAENYVYRMARMEDYLQIAKSDFRMILKEESENTGYDEYLANKS